MTEKPEGKKEDNNVKCSFCGNDTFCDQCKADSTKGDGMEHVCYDCYQGMKGILPDNVKDKTHVCIPQEKIAESFQNFINDVTAKAFAELWNAEKKKLKEMSRQELAEASFFEGARFMFDFMQRMSQDQQNKPAEEKHEHKHDENCKH
ncbi:MAG: hypothetical protein ABH842_01120 [Candidatus Micrarchaeota archaeon]